MAVISKKNVLNLGLTERRQFWNSIRHKPELDMRFSASDLLNMIPGIGSKIGGFVAMFLRFSVEVRGVVEFLIGDDPGSV